jgi:MFS family permease
MARSRQPRVRRTWLPLRKSMRLERSAKGLWAQRDFRILWTGQGVSMLGSNITYLALPLAALTLLKASVVELSLVTFCETLPVVLVALPAGAIVDRCRKSRVMLVCDVGRSFLLASVPAAYIMHVLSIEQIFAVAAASSTMSVFFDAAFLSFPAVTVDRELLVEANAMVSAASSIAQVLGPSLGGILVGLIGAARTVFADALSYAVSAASIYLIRHREKPRTGEQAPVSELLREIMAGLRLVVGDPIQRALTASNAILVFCMTGGTTLWLIFVVRSLGWSGRAAGIVLGIASLGGLTGSLAANALVKRFGIVRVMLAAQLCYAPGEMVVFFVGRGLMGQVIVVGGYAVLLFATLVYVTAQRSFRQLSCPPTMLGRMNASARWLQWSLRPVASLLAGGLGGWIGVRAALICFTAGLAIAPIVLCVSPIRSLVAAGGNTPELRSGAAV